MADKINCIIVDDEPIAREILEFYLKKIPNIYLVKSCKNAKESLEIISNSKIDLILLDINMPEISGLTLAKVIDKKIKVIFTTAYREYAVDGFDIQAVDYLLKPISYDRFLQAINKLFDILNPKISSNKTKTIWEESENDFIFVRSDRKMVKIKFDEILYIESLSDYIKIYTKKKTLVTRETISNMKAKLPNSKFLRIHRSFIISIEEISIYTYEFVKINTKLLPISRTYKENVLQVLNKF
jgi:DNA-binding LytR/AlgR family response regulator